MHPLSGLWPMRAGSGALRSPRLAGDAILEHYVAALRLIDPTFAVAPGGPELREWSGAEAQGRGEAYDELWQDDGGSG